MMSKEKRRVPKLRFPGFTEDWEQRKLGDIATITGGGTPSTNISEYWNGDIDWYSPVEIGENRYVSGSIRKITKLGLEKSSAKILPVGTVLFTSRAGIGNTAILQAEGCTNQGFQSITPNSKELDTYFLYTMTPKLKRYGEVTGAGSTFVEVSGKQMEQMNLRIPSLEEQKHVSQFFKVMDDAITLHQRKLDNLKLKKKALLQKLFPKNGERYPELRFPGFTDAWEQRKLIDITKTFIGLVTTMTENYRDSGTLLIRNSDIKEGQFLFSENPIHLDEEFAEKNKTRRLQIGDVVTVHTGDIGTSAVIEEKEAGAIGFATINTRTDKSILNPYFLATYFNTEKHKCYANSVSTGDGRSNYNIKDFNKLVISVPTLDEQERISVLINAINIIITLHQRKLDHLQLQKKALLQQMFV